MPDEFVFGHRQLRAHDQRQDAGKHEKQKPRRYVEKADVSVVDCRENPPAARRLPNPPQAFQLTLRPGGRIRKAGSAIRSLRSTSVGFLCLRRHLRPPKYAAMARNSSPCRLPNEGIRLPGLRCWAEEIQPASVP